MGVERRRAGFRLPWTAEGEETSEAPAAETNGADESSRAEIESPPAGGTPATEPVTDAAETAAEPASGEAASADTTTTEPTPADASAATPDETTSDEFLKSLVGAMRSVAEGSRDASLAELRTAIDDRIQALGTEAAERETDIRRQADTDLEAVGAWERTEIDRVKAEAETKREARRAKLEQELTEHRSMSERAVEATRSRLEQHENALAAFFAQLSEITDPAAFVAAAKRMPRAPELQGGLAAAVGEAHTSGPAADDPRLAALGALPESSPAGPDTEGETASEAAASEPAEATTEATAEATESARGETAASTNGSSPGGDAQLAERLAQLDERIAGAAETAASPATPTPAPAPGAETSTAIVVKGLGSFGAITSFKQALERVEGVRGVTLSLGPTGEFVYRASHAGDFDLVAAIQTLEGPTASIENTDGTLVVTLSRAR